MVVRKLCASLVAYFLRPTVSWPKCLLQLLSCLNAGGAVAYEHLMSDHAEGAAQILPTLGRSQLLTALWFSVTLIEEVGKTSPTSIQTSVSPGLPIQAGLTNIWRSHKYHERVISTLNDVVELLRATLQPKPNLDRQIAEEGVKCFQVGP